MKIKFLEDVEAQDGRQNTDDAERYEKDQVVDMVQSSAEHWISRGVAVKVEDNVSTPPVSKSDDGKSSVTGGGGSVASSGSVGSNPTVSGTASSTVSGAAAEKK